MRAEDPRINRVEQVGQFSRGLKILARELNVPVIGLSQLSRGPEQRPGQAPAPLGPSRVGFIEQDSDVVTFIYRDAIYNDEADPSEAEFIVPSTAMGRSGRSTRCSWSSTRGSPIAPGASGPIEQKPGEGPPLVDLAEEA